MNEEKRCENYQKINVKIKIRDEEKVAKESIL